MAKTLRLHNSRTGQMRDAPQGFSWTNLLFGFFVPLCRGDWKWAVIQFCAAWLTAGLCWLIFPFIYNNLYLQELLKNGFVIDNMAARGESQSPAACMPQSSSSPIFPQAATVELGPPTTRARRGLLLFCVFLGVAAIASYFSLRAKKEHANVASEPITNLQTPTQTQTAVPSQLDSVGSTNSTIGLSQPENSELGFFQCPETYSSDEAKDAALREFVKGYAEHFPRNNQRDLMLFRYRLLVAHSCIQTLNAMVANVGPLSEMLRFRNQDFGPKTEEYDSETKVWSVWFRKNGATPAFSEADLIFNFYGWPSPSPESIAGAFVRPRQNLRIIGQFEAPDELTKNAAFFVVSEALYSDEKYGYLDMTKISSVGNGSYAVTLAKRINGASISEIERNGERWFLSDDGQANSRELGRIGVDHSWEQYFAQKQQQTMSKSHPLAMCTNAADLISDNMTLSQLGTLITTCGNLPSQNAVQVSNQQQTPLDAACAKTAAEHAPVAIHVKPCPMFISSDDALSFCGTHPANVYVLGAKAELAVASWCPIAFQNTPSPKQAQMFRMLRKLDDFTKQTKQANESIEPKSEGQAARK